MVIKNKLLALAYGALNMLGFEVWIWNGFGPNRYFLSAFGIDAKFPWRKSDSISPYFRGRNLTMLHLKCIIAQKKRYSYQAFHCKNTTTGCLIFTEKIRQSFAFGALWHNSVGFCICVYNAYWRACIEMSQNPSKYQVYWCMSHIQGN